MFRRSAPLCCVVFLVALSGCLGTLAHADAGATTIPTAASEREGYVAGNETRVPFRIPVGVGGVGGEVTVTGHLAGHSRTVAADRTAVLLLVTTPDVRVAGASVNPLRGAADPNVVRTGLELAGRARSLGGVENVTDLREQSVRNVTFLGTTTPLSTYAGVVETDAGRADVRVHVASVEHEGDVVVAVSVHPASMDERDAVSRMLAAAEYRTV